MSSEAVAHVVELSMVDTLNCMPHTVYNEQMDPVTGRITTKPLKIEVPLMADEVSKAIPLIRSVSLDIVLANGQVPHLYDPALGTMAPVARPIFESIDVDEKLQVLKLGIRRSLPISSTSGGSPMRLVIFLADRFVVTNAFFVGAKGHKLLIPRSCVSVPPRSEKTLALLSQVPTIGVCVTLPEFSFAAAPPTADSPAPRARVSKKRSRDMAAAVEATVPEVSTKDYVEFMQTEEGKKSFNEFLATLPCPPGARVLA